MTRTAVPSKAAAHSASSRLRSAPKFVAGSTTLYAQLASVLRGRIFSGEWAPDSDIPSIEELCAQYGLGRITVRQALHILAAEGLVSSQRGRRTFVTYSADSVEAAPLYASLANVETEAPDYTIRVIARNRVAVLPTGRWAVGASSGPYMFVRKIDQSGDQAYAFSGIYVAEDIYKCFPRRAENRSKLLRLVVKYAKSPVTKARERVFVAAADYAEADSLGCPMATPVARVERVFCDDTGRVVYYANTTYRGDRYGMERDLAEYLKGM